MAVSAVAAAIQPQTPVATAAASHGATCPSARAAAVPVVAAAPAAPEEDAEAADAEQPEAGKPVKAIWSTRNTETMKAAHKTLMGFVKASNPRTRDGGDWYDQGMRLHRKGKYEEAIAAFEKAIEDGHREAAASYNIACGYALLGQNDKAFEWLQRSMDEGFDLSAYMGHDDDLDGLRDDPRWSEYKKLARAQKADEHKGEAKAPRRATSVSSPGTRRAASPSSDRAASS